MLIELRVRNYAVVKDVTINLGPGLTVLTGETGAGKSIVVGAISLLIGERAFSDVVRTGADEATVEGVFDVSGVEGVRERLEAAGIPLEGDLMILRRVVARAGRNRAWVNGSPATAALVGSLGRLLVDLHGQHDHQSLLRTGEQRAILDAMAGAEDQAQEVQTLHMEVAEIQDSLDSMEERRRELEGRRDFVAFQLKEIDAVDPRAGEDESLAADLDFLQHAEELSQGAEGLSDLLYSGDEAVADRISGAVEHLRRLAGFDPELQKLLAPLEEAYHTAAEVGRGLADYQASVEMDPGRLEEIRTRLDALARLKRKFGPELSDVLAHRDGLRNELAEMDASTFDRSRVEAELDRARSELTEAARILTDDRSRTARDLEASMMELLPGLGFAGAQFEVALEPLEEVGSHGAESVEFRVSLNPGFPPAPLARVASGGELARVMLALKTILARLDQVPTLIFDEIDAGIGGTVAVSVAERLKDVAQSHQVFVVTHLAQVAAVSDSHLLVEKGVEEEGVANSRIRKMTGEDQVTEVARMLGGDPESEVSRIHARELLTH